MSLLKKLGFSKQESPKPRLVDRLFDPKQGWSESQDTMPVTRVLTSQGLHAFVVHVQGYPCTVFQVDQWHPKSSMQTPANRIVARALIADKQVVNALAFLKTNFEMAGLPSLSVDPDGAIYLQCAFPADEDFPVGLARKQLLNCLGLLAENCAIFNRAS